MSTIDLVALSDDELDVLAHAVDAERGRRRALADAPALAAAIEAEQAARLDEVAASWHAATGQGTGTVEAPVEWVAPTGAHDAWPRGSVVTHEGKTWVSLVGANAHEPGVSGWRELVDDTPGATPAAWVQPAGAHDAYGMGDEVTHKGKTWVSTHNANVWEPGVFGWIEKE